MTMPDTRLHSMLTGYGPPAELHRGLIAVGAKVTLQAVSRWYRQALPSRGVLPHLARLLGARGTAAADVYRAAGVPMPPDLFPG